MKRKHHLTFFCFLGKKGRNIPRRGGELPGFLFESLQTPPLQQLPQPDAAATPQPAATHSYADSRSYWVPDEQTPLTFAQWLFYKNKYFYRDGIRYLRVFFHTFAEGEDEPGFFDVPFPENLLRSLRKKKMRTLFTVCTTMNE